MITDEQLQAIEKRAACGASMKHKYPNGNREGAKHTRGGGYGKPRVKFTTALWALWLARHNERQEMCRRPPL